MNALKSILLLTPSPQALEAALAPLAERGVDVRHVDGAYRFVAAFARRPSDIAILDLEGMERRDLEALRVLREIRPDAGVVALVSLEQRALAAEVLCGGADLYLLKPVAAPELAQAVDRADRLRRAAAPPSEALATDALRDLALAAAHEINNPLATISGWLQMLSEDRAADQQLAATLSSLKQETDRIAEVVCQLLLFAQQEPPSREPTDLANILVELGRAHAPACQARGIRLITHVARLVPLVAGDRKQILHACEAVLADAEAALSPGGRLEVDCGADDDGVRIVFTDDGAPFPPDALARAFRPFQPGRSHDGKQLPLSVCYGIIRSHGGKIELRSDAASGTRFTVWLPSVGRDRESP